MGSSDTPPALDEIQIVRNGIGKIRPDSIVCVFYHSEQATNSRKQVSGVVTTVEHTGSDTVLFRFYDSESERKFEVMLEELCSESTLRSLKSQTWRTIGTPVLLLASNTVTSPELLRQSYLLEHRTKEYDSVAASAKIEQNRSELEWMCKTDSDR